MKTQNRRPKSTRRGLLIARKTSSRKRRGMTIWQWILVAPVLVVLLGAIAIFIYLSYFHPRVGQGIRLQRTTILEKTEVLRTDGTPDPSHSFLLVRIDGQDVRLGPQPNWGSIAKGDTVEVGYVADPDGSMRAVSWKRVASPAP